MSKADAFIFATNKVLERQRRCIDDLNISSIQINISMSRDGRADATIAIKVEESVQGCFNGYSRVDKFVFST